MAGASNAATFSVASEGSNLTWQTGETVLPILGSYYPSARWRPQGYPTIMGTGSNPVRLTIGPGLIDKTVATPAYIATTYPGLPQFTTALSMYAPKAGSTAMFGPGATGKPWPATFSWCPNAAANPACATAVTGPAQGTMTGIVKYTAGTSGPRFGGTMAMFASGRFTWYTVEGPITPTYRLRLNNAPGTTPPEPSVAPGAGYSHYNYYSAGAGDPIFAFASQAAVPKVTTTYGQLIITNPGTPTQIAPGDPSRAWGFPFTTGTVYIKAPFYPDPFLTVTGMGEDNRTPQGIGNITMVAGGLIGHLSGGSGLILPQLFTFTLNVPEPSRVLMLGSGVALLGLVAVARRRTSARAEA
jgi:hypothetical protein